MYTIDSVLILASNFNVAHGYGIPQILWNHPTRGKKYKKHSPLWGYSIKRIKNKEEETVFKFVQPGTKDIKFPPGPGNVCIENNLGSSK